MANSIPLISPRSIGETNKLENEAEIIKNLFMGYRDAIHHYIDRFYMVECKV